MAMVISTNTASINAQRHLTASRQDLDVAMERLSSGQRINSAADDAAGLAIRDKMTSQVEGLNQAVRNANDAISFMQSAEGALEETTNILQRMRTLAVQAVNDTNSLSDRTNLNNEIDKLQEEITRISTTTTFNDKNLIDGTMSSSVFQIGHKTGQTIDISLSNMGSTHLGVKQQVNGVSSATATTIALTVTTGLDEDDTATFNLGPNLNATITGTAASEASATMVTSTAALVAAAITALDGYTATQVTNTGGVNIVSTATGSISDFEIVTSYADTDGDGSAGLVFGLAKSGGQDVSSTEVALVGIDSINVLGVAAATSSIKSIDQALFQVGEERAKLGAFQNRLTHAVNNMTNMSANTAAARSVVADADYAAESSSLAKNQILQQAGTAMLAQANAQAQSVLSLLK